MAETTSIEWTDHTFNPWRGCTKIATGCANCYADVMSKRNPGVLGIWGDHGTRVMASERTWREPFKWDRAAARDGVRRRVFCASLADVFERWDGSIVDCEGNKLFLSSDGRIAALHEFAGVGVTEATMSDLRRRVYALIDATPNLDWLLLSKRPENIRRMWPAVAIHTQEQADDRNERGELWRPNVWIVTSISTQADADANIPALLECRDLVPVLGVSAEPLIEAVDLTEIKLPVSPADGYVHPINECQSADALRGAMYSKCGAGEGELEFRCPRLDWVIVGGESGPHARPCDIAHVRSLVDQCKAAGVPCFVKQLGSNIRDRNDAGFDGGPDDAWDIGCFGRSIEHDPDGYLENYQGAPVRVRLRDPKGGNPAEWPIDLRVREWPEVAP